jgi:hypothetical protein
MEIPKEVAMRFEAEGVLENVLSDLIFYLQTDYTKEESQVWAKVFKETFNDMVDSVLEERVDDEEE